MDVPNATLMVIEHAERMGLAQLHQLRGRVGRGAQREHRDPALLPAALGDGARAAEGDLREQRRLRDRARRTCALRGPGEYLGARQSGAPLLRFADLERDVDLIESARDAAEALLKAKSPAVTKHLDRWLGIAPVLPQGMNKVARAHRRLREADAAGPAHRHPAAAVADALGAVARAARRARPRRDPALLHGHGADALGAAARSTTSPTATSTRKVERTRDRPLAAGAIQPWEALVVAAVCALARVRGRHPAQQPHRGSCPSSALAIAVIYPFLKRFFWMPQAWLGHRLRLRHPDGVRGAQRARSRRSPGRCSPRTSSGPSPTIPSTRWWTATTTLKLGMKTSAILFGRYDVAAVMACYVALHRDPRGHRRVAATTATCVLRGPRRRARRSRLRTTR